METKSSPAPLSAASAASPFAGLSVNPIPATATLRSTVTAPALAPKPGIRTTQLWLIIGVIALLAALVFSGNLNAVWLAIVGPLLAGWYASIREQVYSDYRDHPNDQLDRILATVLSGGDLDGSEIVSIVRAIREHHGLAAPALVLPPPAQPVDTTTSPPTGEEPPAQPPVISRNPLPAALPLCVLAASAFFFLSGCTSMNAQKGTYFTNADNLDTHLRFADGKITSYDSGSNLHSPIIHEYVHGVERVAKIGVNGLLTYSTLGSAPVAASIPSVVDSLVNRPTPTPTPAPALKPAVLQAH